ncbi:hypothetical protein ElyMa_000966200 [Elysia marginata]|uniref:Uncharacterized protein n=1 Tax=Elysia marginata TaxID=1093978 RepID=A0AAV4HFJ3_9GAST|nr:hypothetical protein ElyMa_000966200 [Elysia marginata]
MIGHRERLSFQVVHIIQKTGETAISLTILEARWRPFGHILRQAINTPSNVAKTKYFKTEGSKRRGRPKTSIVTTLRRDLKSHNSDHWPTRLHSRHSTEQIRLEAPDDSNYTDQSRQRRQLTSQRTGITDFKAYHPRRGGDVGRARYTNPHSNCTVTCHHPR